MKLLSIIVCFTFFSQQYLSAQNTGFGTTEPMNKVHIVGNLLVNQPTIATATAPTVAQTKTMVNASTINFLGTDSTGRIYDPGGPAGNYLSNLIAYASVSSATDVTGYELTVETMGIGTGDSLIIKESSAGSAQTLLAVGNGYTTTGKLILNSTSLYIIFKSNTDANNGAGFSLLFRRLYDGSTTAPGIAGVVGKAFYFDTKNGAFRSGMIKNTPAGDYSAAMGFKTSAGSYSIAAGNNSIAANYSIAMGDNVSARKSPSIALGYFSIANEIFATAIGNNANANGISSFAAGLFPTANGTVSVAIGDNTTAIGAAAVAMGKNTVAGGNYSTTLGYYTTANGNSAVARGN